MAGPLPALRALARPLAALGVVAVLVATVLPVLSRADGSYCIGTIGALDPNAWASPICDHCVLAALPAAPPPALPPRAHLRPALACLDLASLVASAPPTERIRDPPAA